MKDQYIKETSQIHAPLELIQRTRQAVREEEMRIRRESILQASAVQSYSDVQPVGKPEPGQFRKSYVKIYRWALPVAAAAVLLLSVNMFRNISKSDMSMSASDAASGWAGEAESAASAEDYMMWDAAPAEEAAEDSMVSDGAQSDGVAEDFMMSEDGYAKGAGNNSMDAGAGQSSISDFTAVDRDQYESGDAGVKKEESVEQEEDMISSEQDENSETAVKADESDEAGNQGTELTVTEVKKMPELFGKEDVEYITVQGVKLAVVQEGADKWSAYVRIGARGYVIAGQAAGLDDFTEQAYELLMETFKERK